MNQIAGAKNFQQIASPAALDFAGLPVASSAIGLAVPKDQANWAG
jgi:hypothetical protein